MKKMNNISKLLILVLVTALSNHAMAKGQGFVCKTPQFERTIVMNDQGSYVHFDSAVEKKMAKIPQRKIASDPTNGNKNKIKVDAFGRLENKFSFENHDYKLVIKDIKQMNEVDDFLHITNQAGHSILYPVSCATI